MGITYFEKFLFVSAFICLNLVLAEDSISIDSYEDFVRLDTEQLFRSIPDNLDIDQLGKLFSFADDLEKNARNKKEKYKANSVISYLAFILDNQIKKEIIDPTNRKTIQLLRNFERHKFIVVRPNHNYLTKLLIYVCEGRYGYVLFRFQQSILFYPVIVIVIILLILELLFFTKVFQLKKLGVLNRFLLYSFLVLLVVFVSFKLSCESCIDNYTFYGIRL